MAKRTRPRAVSGMGPTLKVATNRLPASPVAFLSPVVDDPRQVGGWLLHLDRYVCVKYDPKLDTVFVYKRIGRNIFGWQWWLTDWLGPA